MVDWLVAGLVVSLVDELDPWMVEMSAGMLDASVLKLVASTAALLVVLSDLKTTSDLDSSFNFNKFIVRTEKCNLRDGCLDGCDVG